tara:strand:+ start:2172 stop:2318 length:147 start_codon:yes stop_codon:yes gene_type:complete
VALPSPLQRNDLKMTKYSEFVRNYLAKRNLPKKKNTEDKKDEKKKKES